MEFITYLTDNTPINSAAIFVSFALLLRYAREKKRKKNTTSGGTVFVSSLVQQGMRYSVANLTTTN